METGDKEQIRDAVRQRYKQIAKAENANPGESQAAPCCSPSNAIADQMPAASCCSGPEVTPEQISTVMGYSKRISRALSKVRIWGWVAATLSPSLRLKPVKQ